MKHANREYTDYVETTASDDAVAHDVPDADNAAEMAKAATAEEVTEVMDPVETAVADEAEDITEALDAIEAETIAEAEDAVEAEDIEEVADSAEETAEEPTEEQLAEKKRRRDKIKKNIGIGLASVVGAAAIAWGGGCLFFMGHMYPNATFDGEDISLMDKDQAAEVLNGLASDYSLTLDGNDFHTELSAEDIAFTYDSAAAVEDIFSERTIPAWPAEIFETHEYTRVQRGSIDEERLSEILEPQLAEHNESARHTTNAYLGYNEDTGEIDVRPEEYGTYMLPEAVLAKATMSARSMQHTAELGRDEVEQPSILSTDEVLNSNVERANELTQASIDLKVGDETVETIDRKQLVNWLEFNDENVIVLNESKVEDWAREFAESHSTLNRERHYTRADGKEITVPAGYYGWDIDVDEFVSLFLEKVDANEKGEFQVPCYSTARVFPDAGGRDWGNRYIDIDLSEQYARYYDDNGDIIWETAIVSGAPDGMHNTPVGVWFLEKKESPSKLIGYENGKKIYETWVTYWMPFIDNGVGLHDATWQYSFGGTRYADGYGSHGCVNISYSAAEELYYMIADEEVIITHY